MSLPIPSPEALEHSASLHAHLASRIQAEGGWLSFAPFMEALLYAPGLGYYAAGSHKFGAAGDFVTAPEMTPLFATALARQIGQLMAASAPCILEAGAGSGQLAVDLLSALEARGELPEQYFILDLSPDLRQRQQALIAARLPHLAARVEWLDCLPAQFNGVVIGNEVLDAMPAHIVRWVDTGIEEQGVTLSPEGQFSWQARPATGSLLSAAEEIARQVAIPPGLLSEISLANRAWAAEWGHRLVKGAILLLDYGFPRREYYHAQRAHGTLMCHYRHHAHPDPFYLPGLQDVTVHVDFTAIIAAAHPQGLDLLGYTSQGQFLLNCGILDALASMPQGTPAYVAASGAVNRLIMPHEMGELFKVIALGRGLEDVDPVGFTQGDQSYRL